MKKYGLTSNNMFSRFIGFVLGPAVRIVRFAALKLMKKLRRPYDDRPIHAAAEHMLDEIVLPAGFRVFRDARFRELASFKKLPTAEHDRIFNEIVVTDICVLLFYLGSIKSIVRPEDYHFWQDVEERVPKQYQRVLMRFGVDGGHAKLFRQLIEMRYEEYKKITKDVWKTNDTAKSEFHDLPGEVKHLTAATQAAAVGAADHMRRGKLEKNDPLIGFLVERLAGLRRKIHKFVRRLG